MAAALQVKLRCYYIFYGNIIVFIRYLIRSEDIRQFVEMVSLFCDVNTREERLEFSGSSSEDISCAKLFWQTVCLQPHLESELVSSDVSQRRRSAPLPGLIIDLSLLRTDKRIS